MLLNITFLDYGRPEFCSLPDALIIDSLSLLLIVATLSGLISQVHSPVILFLPSTSISVFHYQSSSHHKSSTLFLELL